MQYMLYSFHYFGKRQADVVRAWLFEVKIAGVNK